MYAQVVLSTVSSFFDKPFTYSVPRDLEASAMVGMQVKVPFGKRTAVGYIISVSDHPGEGITGIKDIMEVRGETPFFSEQSVKTALWLSKYYISFIGSSLKTVLPPGFSGFERSKGKKRLQSEPKAAAASPLNISAPSKGIAADILSATSGGALVIKNSADRSENTYLELAGHMLSQGKGMILLYPDAEYLSPAVHLFRKELGRAAAVLHSSMPEKDRLSEWKRINSGEAVIILGTRAAVFAPVKNLGLIVIDREEGYAYKQETSPKYNAGTAAVFRSRSEKVPVAFFSSCPTPESYHLARIGAMRMIDAGKGSIACRAKIEIIDMNKEKRSPGGIFSLKLMERLEDVLARKGNVLLIAGRKGHSTSLSCADCGTSVKCPSCGTSLVYSMEDNKILCGRCGFSSGTSIVCANCLGTRIKFTGTGTQKVDAEVRRAFPFARTLRIDRDSVSKGRIASIVSNAFDSGTANVVIGSRLAAKAAELVDFDLVGVVSADTALASGGFRSAEETFRLLYELAVTGRGNKSLSTVAVQTYNPGHYALSFAAALDLEGFYDKELEYRKAAGDPPFGQFIKVTVSGKDELAAETSASRIASGLEAAPAKVLGPVRSRVPGTRGQAKWQILIKGKDLDIIKAELGGIARSAGVRGVRISVDVDPIE